MSKSLGNLVFVSDLLKTADARAIRLALMRHHYRAGLRVARHRPRRGHRAAAPPPRRRRVARRRRSRTVRGARPRRDRRRPRRSRRRSKRSTTSPAPSSPGGDDPDARPVVLLELGARSARHRPHPPVGYGPGPERAEGRLVTSAHGGWDQITITLPDGSTRDYGRGVTAGEIAASIGRGLAKAALAPRRVDGRRRVGRPRSPDRPRRRGRDRHARHAPTGARCCGTRRRT